MKTPRERFEENYIAVEKPCKNKRGFRIYYVYYGPWYLWDEDPKQLQRIKVKIGVAFFASLAFLLISACYYSALNYSIIGLPMGISLAAAVFSLIGVIQFLISKRKFTRVLYKDINAIFQIAIPLQAGLLFATVILAIYIWISKQLSFLQAMPTFGYLASAVCVILTYRLYKNLNFRTEDNPMSMTESIEEKESKRIK